MSNDSDDESSKLSLHRGLYSTYPVPAVHVCHHVE